MYQAHRPIQITATPTASNGQATTLSTLRAFVVILLGGLLPLLTDPSYGPGEHPLQIERQQKHTHQRSNTGPDNDENGLSAHQVPLSPPACRQAGVTSPPGPARVGPRS